MSNKQKPVKTVLFDLDGTLVDTAPDLAAALNTVLKEEGRTPAPYSAIRAEASYGGKALVSMCFDLDEDHVDFEKYRKRFLDHYVSNICVLSKLFDGMDDVIEKIESSNQNWGVVTNKPSYLTDPLMEALGLTQRAACVVSGDTTAKSKPDPMPIMHACKITGAGVAECIYIGDAQRDIEAGRRAGMRTLAASFGYLRDNDNPSDWGADKVVSCPKEITEWLNDNA